MELSQVAMRPVQRAEEERFRELMQQHHYLGAPHTICETLW